jgi:GTP-binding protein
MNYCVKRSDPLPKHKPLVAIVGRPNVGKSTFFNTIVGRRIAIVKDTPGVTRDRIYGDTEWTGKEFTLIDTGGIDTQSDDIMLGLMRQQAEIAIETADLICFFTDARSGLMHQDMEIANLLRRSNKPVILVVNKVDTAELADQLYEYYELGLGDPVGISSTNMLGLGDLLDEIVKHLPANKADDHQEDYVINLAIVGKPNVGKSSLTNRLLGQDRMMVSDIPGTTRDAVDTMHVRSNGCRYNIIDTAGIRRKRSIKNESLERYSVIRSIAAIRRCDVALLMIDAQDGVTEQDTKIAGLIKDEGKAVIVLVNKWDLLEKNTGTYEQYQKEVIDKLKFISYAPSIMISALTGQRVNAIWDMIDYVYEQYSRRITTGLVNEVFAEAQASLQTPMMGGKRLKILYVTQQDTCPPTFVLFVNDEDLLHYSYERFLENQLRKAFDLTGTPIRFIIRQRKEEHT